MRSPDGSAELGHRLADIGRHFADAPGQNIKIIVLIQLEAPEITQSWETLRQRLRRRIAGRRALKVKVCFSSND